MITKTTIEQILLQALRNVADEYNGYPICEQAIVFAFINVLKTIRPNCRCLLEIPYNFDQRKKCDVTINPATSHTVNIEFKFIRGKCCAENDLFNTANDIARLEHVENGYSIIVIAPDRYETYMKPKYPFSLCNGIKKGPYITNSLGKNTETASFVLNHTYSKEECEVMHDEESDYHYQIIAVNNK